MFSDFQSLKEETLACQKCPLCETRNKVVFGAGNETAEVLFVGEGPGGEEDKQGEPFVGKAGILFDKYLKHIDLDRNKNIYIANIVKCRPPQNRDPKEEEQAACIPYLKKQIALIQPKIIVCLGRIAAQKLISPDFRVTKEHGKFYEKPPFYVMGTYHPAALLRNPANKGAALEDFLLLQQKIYEVCERTY